MISFDVENHLLFSVTPAIQIPLHLPQFGAGLFAAWWSICTSTTHSASLRATRCQWILLFPYNLSISFGGRPVPRCLFLFQFPLRMKE
uniref:Uncharacterized protein n=1 Tax=Arundo donax TaxID=35708 RepID=A0A0A9CUD2_ARUDO